MLPDIRRAGKAWKRLSRTPRRLTARTPIFISYFKYNLMSVLPLASKRCCKCFTWYLWKKISNYPNLYFYYTGSKKLKIPLPAERKTIKLNWRSSNNSNKRQETRLEKWRISWNKQHLTEKIIKLNCLETMEELARWNLSSVELKPRKMTQNSSCRAFTRSFEDRSAYEHSPDLRHQTKAARRKTDVLSEDDRDRGQVNTIWILCTCIISK